jgi:branched-chain amino acid transport system permease protein
LAVICYEREHLQQVLMTCPVYRLFISGVCLVLALGIDIKFLYRVAVLAGMVAAPVPSVYPNMGDSVLIICFVTVVIGGIGSIRGALLLIGFVDTFDKVFLPQAAGVLVYVRIALILLWKPDGLFKAG